MSCWRTASRCSLVRTEQLEYSTDVRQQNSCCRCRCGSLDPLCSCQLSITWSTWPLSAPSLKGSGPPTFPVGSWGRWRSSYHQLVEVFLEHDQTYIQEKVVISLSSQVVERACHLSVHYVIVKCIKISSDQHQLVLIENICMKHKAMGIIITLFCSFLLIQMSTMSLPSTI